MMITNIFLPSQDSRVLLGLIAILLSGISYFVLSKKSSPRLSPKAKRAKEMKKAFANIEKYEKNHRNSRIHTNLSEPLNSMAVKELFIYPIKSLRPISVPAALLTPTGFHHDRTFMLHSIQPSGELKNMAISSIPSMSLFHPSFSPDFTKLHVQYREPGTLFPSGEILEVDLDPDVTGLEKVPVEMHSSPTTGYNMGLKVNKWFSERFGYEVVLTYWGGNPRVALGMLPGRPPTEGPKPKSGIQKVLEHIPILGDLVIGDDNDKIAFNDCAPYMVINQASVDEVSSRLPPSASMDPTKFRSNIIVSSPNLKAWEEDLWGSLEFPQSERLACRSLEREEKGAKIILTGNCGRCKSLNVDYRTGETGTTDDVKVFHHLQKDRRVDEGVKYTPIFGRYGFVGTGGEGVLLRVGDEVRVGERLEATSKFYWPGLTN